MLKLKYNFNDGGACKITGQSSNVFHCNSSSMVAVALLYISNRIQPPNLHSYKLFLIQRHNYVWMRNRTPLQNKVDVLTFGPTNTISFWSNYMFQAFQVDVFLLNSQIFGPAIYHPSKKKKKKNKEITGS